MMASFDCDDDRGLPVRKLGEHQVLSIETQETDYGFSQ